MNQSPVVETRDLSKHYRHPFFTWKIRARALTDLQLTIERGEVFGLLGPNGSGKSTTIKLLLGLIFPTTGSVRVFGCPPSDVHVKERIGYLPEESYLYKYLNAEETLDFYGRLFPLSRHERRRRSAELLELVGLNAAKKRPVGEYSKGMQRRVALAQALINNPEFLVLDEPTSGMDPIATAEIKALIGQLRDLGKTVLLCSHLLANVEDVCDRVTILSNGRQRVTGRLDQLISDSQERTVTALMKPGTVDAVSDLIREREGTETAVQVTPKVERLEEFFLRVVESASDDGPDRRPARDHTRDLGFLSELNSSRPQTSATPVVAEAGSEQPSPAKNSDKNDGVSAS